MWGGRRPVNLQIIALVQPGMAYKTQSPPPSFLDNAEFSGQSMKTVELARSDK